MRIDSADLDAFVAAGRVAPAVPVAVPENPGRDDPRDRVLRSASGRRTTDPVRIDQ